MGSRRNRHSLTVKPNSDTERNLAEMPREAPGARWL